MQTAMAKGGPFGCRIIGTLLNAGIPIVTLLGLRSGALIGGAVMVEPISSHAESEAVRTSG